jgi:hypothetical protein
VNEIIIFEKQQPKIKTIRGGEERERGGGGVPLYIS